MEGLIFIDPPAQRVCSDIFSEVVGILVVTEDSIVIIALPDRFAWSIAQFIDPFCGIHFEKSNDQWYGHFSAKFPRAGKIIIP